MSVEAIKDQAAPARAIRVVVVDDSALIREMLSAILNRDPEIEVVGAARDPLIARDMIKQHNPDVVTLDIEMPRMDGLAFLEKIMTLRPMPVVMISSLTQAGADATMQALEIGAVDFVGKPAMDLRAGVAEMAADIVAKVKAAARARVRGGRRAAPSATAAKPIGFRSTEKIVAIGASTGGVEAIREVVCALPADSPAILATQHMPERFTSTFAARLDTVAKVKVAEAVDGQRVLPGHVYIAPGGRHLELSRSGANFVTRLTDAPPVSGHRPSVDVLFRSVAAVAGANSVGVILTGMGKDGAAGLLEMRQAGARTVGQDEASCTVYGMPKVAYELGAVERQAPLGDIATKLLDACGSEKLRAVRV
ncbi:MAG: chemotaxis response regulator protein-glutamate methylesterase [Alphaproteobacteria bacterium]